jgi:hypothetical protein
MAKPKKAKFPKKTPRTKKAPKLKKAARRAAASTEPTVYVNLGAVIECLYDIGRMLDTRLAEISDELRAFGGDFEPLKEEAAPTPQVPAETADENSGRQSMQAQD